MTFSGRNDRISGRNEILPSTGAGAEVEGDEAGAGAGEAGDGAVAGGEERESSLTPHNLFLRRTAWTARW